MKSATADAKPAWLASPRDIVSANVCRLSGKRPAGGCDSVQVALPDGSTTQRTQVMSEYFVRGTEPTDTCHLHVGRSLLAKMGEWFRDSPPVERNGPVDAAPAATDVPAAGTPAEGEEQAAAEGEPKKKRGFWSRVFGRGERSAEEKKAEEEKKKARPRP
jgi:hypothetical protein